MGATLRAAIIAFATRRALRSSRSHAARRQVHLCVRIDDLSCGQFILRIHPHVQRCVARIGKPRCGSSSCMLETLRSNKIALIRPPLMVASNDAKFSCSPARGTNRSPKLRKSLRRHRRCNRIAIDTDQCEAGEGRKKCLTVPAEAKGCINQNSVWFVDRWAKEFKATIEEHWDVHRDLLPSSESVLSRFRIW